MDIVKLRNDKGLTQKELAALLGCARFTVQRWETGGVTPLPVYARALEQIAAGDMDVEIERIKSGKSGKKGD